MIGTPAGLKVTREFQRCLAAILHDDAEGFLYCHDFEHILECERLEIKTVRSIVIGGNGFRVAIDHDRFETIVAQRQRRMDTTVIKLYSLADAIGPAAQHHYFFSVRWVALRTPLHMWSTCKLCEWQTRLRKYPRACIPASR